MRIFSAAFAAILLSTHAIAAVRAIDGDTVVIDGETIRLANIDAPETGGAKCDAELRLGRVAKSRLEFLLSSGTISLIRGDGSRMKDRYGRTLGRITIDGKDVGETLIAEELARPWQGRRKSWC